MNSVLCGQMYSGALLATAVRLLWDPSTYTWFRYLCETQYRVTTGYLLAAGLWLAGLVYVAASAAHRPATTCLHLVSERTNTLYYFCNFLKDSIYKHETRQHLYQLFKFITFQFTFFHNPNVCVVCCWRCVPGGERGGVRCVDGGVPRGVVALRPSG